VFTGSGAISRALPGPGHFRVRAFPHLLREVAFLVSVMRLTTAALLSALPGQVHGRVGASGSFAGQQNRRIVSGRLICRHYIPEMGKLLGVLGSSRDNIIGNLIAQQSISLRK